MLRNHLSFHMIFGTTRQTWVILFLPFFFFFDGGRGAGRVGNWGSGSLYYLPNVLQSRLMFMAVFTQGCAQSLTKPCGWDFSVAHLKLTIIGLPQCMCGSKQRLSCWQVASLLNHTSHDIEIEAFVLPKVLLLCKLTFKVVSWHL